MTSYDRRLARNIDRVRDMIRNQIKERRSGKTKSVDTHADLLSILIESEMYEKDDEMIIDEIFTFFLAGMRTIQVSTTNTIYHLLQNP